MRQKGGQVKLRPAAPPQASKAPLVDLAEILARPYSTFAIRGVLPEKGLAAVFGASGTGKSFLVLDMIHALVRGEPWFDYRVPKVRKVILFALEGKSGLRQRIEAIERRKGSMPPDSVSIWDASFSLTSDDAVAKALRAIEADGGADVIVIDTLNRASASSDENRSADMGKIIAGASELAAACDGLVLLIHHTGKDESRGLRGHSSLLAALDAAIEVRRGERDVRSWRIAKAKDAPEGEAKSFVLEEVGVAADEHGDPITSSVVVQSDAAVSTYRSENKLGSREAPVMAAMVELTTHAGIPVDEHMEPDFDAPQPSFALEEVIATVRRALDFPNDKRLAERCKSSLQSLAGRGLLECVDERYRLPPRG